MMFPGMIWHTADHESTNLIMFCPYAYAKCVSNTFQKCPEVFRSVEGTPQHYAQIMQDLLPQSLRSFRKRKALFFLPSAFILPKRKKMFRTGRPVIRFHKSPYANIFRAAGRIYQDLCADLFGNQAYGQATVQQCFRKLQVW